MEKKKRIIKCPAAGEGGAAEPLRGRGVNGRPELQGRQNYGFQRGLEIRGLGTRPQDSDEKVESRIEPHLNLTQRSGSHT